MRKRGGLGRGLGALIPSAPQPTAGPAVEAAGADTTAAPEAQDSTGSTEESPELAAADDPGGQANGTESAAAAVTSETTDPQDDSSELAEVPGAEYAELPVEQISVNPRQPREQFDEEAMAELRASVREVGVLQPVVVRRSGPGHFELIMGERRWRASVAEHKVTIPAIIRDVGDDAMLRDALLENIHRSDLNPLEEAAAYQQLLQEFGATQEELANRIGRSRPQISNTLRLLQLPPAVQRRVAARVLSAGHARALLGLEDAEAQAEFATRIVAEGLSVRATEELVSVAGSKAPAKNTAAKNRGTLRSPGIDDLAEQLSDRFDTRVKVQLGRRKGRVVIEFASVDDLERIAGVMGVAGRRGIGEQEGT